MRFVVRHAVRGFFPLSILPELLEGLAFPRFCAGSDPPGACRGNRCAASTAIWSPERPGGCPVFGGFESQNTGSPAAAGNSPIFHYLDGRQSIPDDAGRNAFPDSNYACDAAGGHAAGLAAWLKGGPARF